MKEKTSSKSILLITLKGIVEFVIGNSSFWRPDDQPDYQTDDAGDQEY